MITRLVCLTLLLPGVVFAKTAGHLETAWREAAGLRLIEADAGFRAALAEDPGSPEARLGLAIAGLNVPPISDGKLAALRVEFDALSRETAKPGIAVAARYFLARLTQVHDRRPDLPAASAQFLAIYREFPQTWYGQMAWIKHLILELATAPDDTTRLARLDAFDDAAVTLPDPALNATLHLVLGNARLRHDRRSPRALEHFLAADQAGISQAAARTNTTVAIAEIARDLGKQDVATLYYRRFLAENPRDSRVDVVRGRLKNLDPAASPPTP